MLPVHYSLVSFCQLAERSGLYDRRIIIGGMYAILTLTIALVPLDRIIDILPGWELDAKDTKIQKKANRFASVLDTVNSRLAFTVVLRPDAEGSPVRGQCRTTADVMCFLLSCERLTLTCMAAAPDCDEQQ